MRKNSTTIQRIKDFRAFCAAENIRIKHVTDRAGLKYHSVINNMRLYVLSKARIDLLEKHALEIHEENKKQVA